MSLVIRPVALDVAKQVRNLSTDKLPGSEDFVVRTRVDLDKLGDCIKNYAKELGGVLSYITTPSIPTSHEHFQSEMTVKISNPNEPVEVRRDKFWSEGLFFEVKIGWGDKTYTRIKYCHKIGDELLQAGTALTTYNFEEHLSASKIIEYFKEFLAAFASTIDEWELNHVRDAIESSIQEGKDVPSLYARRAIVHLPDDGTYDFGDTQLTKEGLYKLAGSTGPIKFVRTVDPGRYSLVPA